MGSIVKAVLEFLYGLFVKRKAEAKAEAPRVALQEIAREIHDKDDKETADDLRALLK